MSAQKPIIEVENLKTVLGGVVVHENLNCTINQGEIVAIIGGSGCGKTTLLRSILMLQQPISGSIHILGIDVLNASEKESLEIKRQTGVLFQSSALFSSFTILENVVFPLKEQSGLPNFILEELARFKIKLVGLDESVASHYPSELSGGMKKRAAMARAIVLDPQLLFLDEPTAGLDPKSASGLDKLILELRHNLGLTIVIVTHDLATLWRVPDRVLFMAEGKILSAKPMRELVQDKHPLIQEYFLDSVNLKDMREIKGVIDG